MRIVIAEDEQMFREVLKKVCVEDFGHDVVGEAEDGEVAVKVVNEVRPDLLLLDLVLPRMHGFEVADHARRSSRGTRIVAVTSSCASYTLYRLERAGFDGYIHKGGQSLGALRDAISAVARGSRYHSPIFSTIRDARLRDPNGYDKVLSDRELEVLCHIGMSMNDEEIGEALGICAKTAETFRHRILKKLGVRGTPKLIRFAIENGFTQLEASGAGRLE
jgi:DNA-binding NarL/FixJ family response regulator